MSTYISAALSGMNTSRRIGMAEPSIEARDPILDAGSDCGLVTPYVKSPEAVKFYMANAGLGAVPEPAPGTLNATWDSQAIALKQFQELRDDISLIGGPLWDAEAEHFRKGCMQAGASSGWHAIPGGLSGEINVKHDLAEEFQLVLELLLANGQAALERLKRAYYSFPSGTNHGWPTYQTDDDDLGLHMIMSQGVVTWDDVCEIGSAAARWLNDPVAASMPPHATMWSRTGHTDKFIDEWAANGNGWIRSKRKSRGVFPRRRPVFGVSAFVNAALRQEQARVKAFVQATPQCGHTAKEITASQVARSWNSPGSRVISDDISAFDMSVPFVHQENLARIVYSKLFAVPSNVDLYVALQKMGVLAPSLSGDSACVIYGRLGRTLSGSIFTSMDGTLINFARMLYCIGRATGLGSKRAAAMIASGEIGAWVWGDDTLLCVKKGFDDDEYVQASIDCGYTCKLSSAPVFLMTYFGRNGEFYNLASRVFMGTVWREHQARSPAFELFGLAARLHMLRTHPLRSSVWDAIRRVSDSSGFLRQWKVQHERDVDIAIRSPEFKTALELEAKERPRRARDAIMALTSGAVSLDDEPGKDDHSLRYVLRLSGAEDAFNRARYIPSPGVEAAMKRAKYDWRPEVEEACYTLSKSARKRVVDDRAELNAA